LLPLWEAQHGEIGSSVSIGLRGMQAAFVAPAMILFGLALLIGGDWMMAMTEGEKRHGRLFWCAFAAIAILLGGAHVWWFKHEMAALGYRDAYPGHMTKQSSSSALDPAEELEAMHIPSAASLTLAQSADDSGKVMWDAMSPEMRKKLPELEPKSGGTAMDPVARPMAGR